MSNDKIPIGKYFPIENNRKYDGYVEIKLKYGVNISIGDIITLDMIEPYESEAVRKVRNYISGFMCSASHTKDETEYWTEHAREIVDLVHEAEDADE